MKIQCSPKTDVFNKRFSVLHAFVKPMQEQQRAFAGARSKEIDRERENRSYKVPLSNNFRNFIISSENICPEFLDMHVGRKGSCGF